MDPTDRVRNTDIKVDPNEVIMISKDTAYIDEEGNIVNETITRPRSVLGISCIHGFQYLSGRKLLGKRLQQCLQRTLYPYVFQSSGI